MSRPGQASAVRSGAGRRRVIGARSARLQRLPAAGNRGDRVRTGARGLRATRYLNPRSLSEFVTTDTLEKAMASEASMGCSVPCQPSTGPTGPPSRSSR